MGLEIERRAFSFLLWPKDCKKISLSSFSYLDYKSNIQFHTRTINFILSDCMKEGKEESLIGSMR